MISCRRTAAAFSLLALMGAGAPGASAEPRHGQDDPYEQVKSYDFQNRTAVAAIHAMIQQAMGDKAKTAAIEQHLIGVLQDPASTFAAKQEVCRMLWLAGSPASVPTLQKMLGDEEKISNIARYALERNADPSAARALRIAVGTLERNAGLGESSPSLITAEVGIINSIGDRADADAVPLLKPLAASSDPLVSEAAITALGKIGSASALTVLRGMPADNMPVNKALVRCAERLQSAGKRAESAAVYQSLVAESRPSIIRVEAVRGLSAIQSPRASSVALAALKSTDPLLQEAGARIAGSMADPQTTSRCLVIYPTLPPNTEVVLLTAMADRREPAATSIALSAIASPDAGLRQAGILSAPRVAGAKAVPRLIEAAVHGEGSDKSTARDTLAGIPGSAAEQAILVAAKTGPSDVRAVLMGVLAERPTPAAMNTLLQAANGPDARVAVEAVRSLGRVGGAPQQSMLVKLLVSTPADDVRDSAKDAVVAIVQRTGGRDQSSEQLIAALPSASSAAKASILSALAQLGGDQAFATLTQATTSSDGAVKQAAVAALADNWSDTRPLPTLLNIAKTDADKATRVQALRGYLRLVGQNDRDSGDAKADQVAQALAAAERPEEKKQALGILRDTRVPHAVALAAGLLDDPAVFPEAADAVIYLAAPQKKGDLPLAAVTGQETTAALDKVIQLTKDDNQRALAQKLR